MWQRFILLSLLHAHSHRSLILETIDAWIPTARIMYPSMSRTFSAASSKTTWPWRLENPLEELYIGSARPISFHRILETPSRPVMKVFSSLLFIMVFFYLSISSIAFSVEDHQKTQIISSMTEPHTYFRMQHSLSFCCFIKKVHPHWRTLLRTRPLVWP